MHLWQSSNSKNKLAKKDDFEQRAAQCLVEMKACQWRDLQVNKPMDVYGVVTNGDTWRFYRMTLNHQVYESLAYSIGSIDLVLGWLHWIFQACGKHWRDGAGIKASLAASFQLG